MYQLVGVVVNVVVYLALAVTLSAIFQTAPAAAPHFFPSVHICIGYMRVCTPKESREQIEFRISLLPRCKSWPAKMDVDACAGERMGVGVRSRIFPSPPRAFPSSGGRPTLPSPMQLNALTTIPHYGPDIQCHRKGRRTVTEKRNNLQSHAPVTYSLQRSWVYLNMRCA